MYLKLKIFKKTAKMKFRFAPTTLDESKIVDNNGIRRDVMVYYFLGLA